MEISLKELEKTLADHILELNEIYRFDISDGGIVIKASKSESNSSCLCDGIFKIGYIKESYIYRALKNLAAGLTDYREETRIFDDFGTMIDCSRNAVYKVDTIKKMIRYMAVMGYNTLQIYIEDVLEVDNEPYFGYLRGGFHQAEIKEIDAYAAKFGIELVPCIQTLAHLNQIFRWPEYRPINDLNDILLAKDERTYTLLENLFATVAACFRSRKINIGMDEARLVGLGKYLDKYGYSERIGILTAHLEKVLELSGKHGFKAAMWSDMFFRLAFNGEYDSKGNLLPEETKALIPDNVSLIYWDYYHQNKKHYDMMLSAHKDIGNNLIFAGGAWTWSGFVPCNNFSINANREAFVACRKHGVKCAFITMWHDNGAETPLFSALPSLVNAAENAYSVTDKKSVRASFKAIAHTGIDDFLNIELLDGRGSKDRDYLNPSKYLLYNDCFLGIMDSAVTDDYDEFLKKSRQKLKKLKNDPEWGYMFKSYFALADALSLKFDLGIQIRSAYKARDMQKLKILIKEKITPLIKKLEEFYKSFKVCWKTEKRNNGFEIQDYRIGGLIRRIIHQKEMLEDLIDGKTSKIEELETEILDFGGNGTNHSKSRTHINNFIQISSVNIF